MDMQELANRMDATVQAMLDAQSRDITEATLIRTAASLLDKLNDRDLQIKVLRSQIEELSNDLMQLKQRLSDDGK
jgi:septal ring factor EnvC (AmiA/AmiB activator)